MKFFTPACILTLIMVLAGTGATSALQAQGRVIDLPEVVRPGEGQTPVQVISSDAGLQNLLRRAFSLHGAYNVISSGQAGYTFRFQPVSSTSVRVQIETGGQVRFTQDVSGGDQRDAALRAADLAVSRTTGKPGFFAGKIAFVGDRAGGMEIFTSDLFFERVSQLTRDRNKALGPNWSPDGTKIIYTTYHASGFPDLYQIDLSSGRRSAFATFRGTNTGGAFSPRGDRVAVIMSGSGNAELYTVNTQGRDVRRLTRTDALESDPSWSPDGTQIVYSADPQGRPQLYVVNSNGGSPRRLATNISGYCAEPRWNPVDSSKIAFTIAQNREFEIALWDFRSNSSKTLTRGTGDAMEARWLNDGRHLIYTQRVGAVRRLCILDTETGKITQLTPNNMGNTWQASFVYPR